VTFFVCESNISETAERICAKFTGTCLVRRSEEFECQGHHGQKRAVHFHHPLAAYEWYALAANITQQQTAPFRRCREGVISAACVRFMFGKTSLALVVSVFSISYWICVVFCFLCIYLAPVAIKFSVCSSICLKSEY